MPFVSKPFMHDEAMLWPNGPVCPYCGNDGQRIAIYVLKGLRTKSSNKNLDGVVRPCLKKCSACRKQFTARHDAIFEGRHIPLHTWQQARLQR